MLSSPFNKHKCIQVSNWWQIFSWFKSENHFMQRTLILPDKLWIFICKFKFVFNCFKVTTIWYSCLSNENTVLVHYSSNRSMARRFAVFVTRLIAAYYRWRRWSYLKSWWAIFLLHDIVKCLNFTPINIVISWLNELVDSFEYC